MATSQYLLEAGTDGYLLEDGSGVLLMEQEEISLGIGYAVELDEAQAIVASNSSGGGMGSIGLASRFRCVGLRRR